jgi:hypothetical protein
MTQRPPYYDFNKLLRGDFVDPDAPSAEDIQQLAALLVRDATMVRDYLLETQPTDTYAVQAVLQKAHRPLIKLVIAAAKRAKG